MEIPNVDPPECLLSGCCKKHAANKWCRFLVAMPKTEPTRMALTLSVSFCEFKLSGLAAWFV